MTNETSSAYFDPIFYGALDTLKGLGVTLSEADYLTLSRLVDENILDFWMRCNVSETEREAFCQNLSSDMETILAGAAAGSFLLTLAAARDGCAQQTLSSIREGDVTLSYADTSTGERYARELVSRAERAAARYRRMIW